MGGLVGFRGYWGVWVNKEDLLESLGILVSSFFAYLLFTGTYVDVMANSHMVLVRWNRILMVQQKEDNNSCYMSESNSETELSRNDKDSKDSNKSKNMLLFLEKWKSIIMVVICVLFLIGLRDSVFNAYDKYLLSIFNIKANDILSVSFLLFSLWTTTLVILRYYVSRKPNKIRKIVSIHDGSITLFIISLFFLFRISHHYSFVCFWASKIAYVDSLILPVALVFILFVIQRFHKNGNDKDNRLNEFLHDSPLDPEHDEDIFHMDSYVERIIDYLKDTDIKDRAFSIGIVGKWGEGKSSIINLIDSKLDDSFLSFKFNPRASKDISYIQEDFLRSLSGILTPRFSGVNKLVAQYAETINIKDFKSAPQKWLFYLFKEAILFRDTNPREELQSVINRIGKKIVVYIDDLDRLTAEELLETFKVIDKNGSFGSIFFITAYDKVYVNNLLEKKLLSNQPGIDYTDKYFTVELNIPKHPIFKIQEFFISLIKDAINKERIKLDVSVAEQTIVLSSNLIFSRLSTIRDVKRFVNQFIINYSGIQDEVDFRDYLLLELIKYSHHGEYIQLSNRDYLITSGDSKDSDDLWYLKDSFFEPISDNSNLRIPDCIDILKILFPQRGFYRQWYADRDKKIYSVSAFEFYFFNYEFDHLKQSDFTDLYNLTLSEACDRVKGWAKYQRDIDTYFLCKKINTLSNLSNLRRYFQLLNYVYEHTQSINYWSALNRFYFDEEVTKIIPQFEVKSRDQYIDWFKDSLMELSSISSLAGGKYLIFSIDSFLDSYRGGEYFYFSLEEMQSIALEVLRKYLSAINNNGWSSYVAFELYRIRKDKHSLMDLAAASLKESISEHFEKYSKGLVVFNNMDAQGVVVSFVFLFNQVFHNPNDFESVINNPNNNGCEEIDLIRSFWLLFSANNYSNVILPLGTDVQSLKQTCFSDYCKQLKDIIAIREEVALIDKRLNSKNRKFSKEIIDNIRNTIETKKKRLSALSLSVEIKMNVFQQITKIEERLTYLVQHLKDISPRYIRKGDLVSIRNINKYTSSLLYRDVFAIDEVLKDNMVKIRGLNTPVAIEDLEAISIDEKTKEKIYYIDNDTTVLKDSLNIRKLDQFEFMNYFKTHSDAKNRSYVEIFKARRLQYIHEVQHWLRRNQNNDLKLLDDVLISL